MFVKLRTERPLIKKGIENLCSEIIDCIIDAGGNTTIRSINLRTDLDEVDDNLAFNLIRLMINSDIPIEADEYHVYGNVAELINIKDRDKINLPFNHNKLWSENDIVIMCEMLYHGSNYFETAQKLHRTEGAIKKKESELVLAYKTIPIVKKYAIVRMYLEKKAGPNPA